MNHAENQNAENQNTDHQSTTDDQPVDPQAAAAGKHATGAAADELQRLQEERDHFEAQLQRALADTANIRRRQKQELDELRRRTLEGITQELLPVLDSFSMALQAHDQQALDQGSGADQGSGNALIEGVRLVRTLLSAALERHGLQEIPAAGLQFDPARHEAVAVEANAAVPAGQVLRVLQTGYQLGDRVVRHSRVVVAGQPPASAS